MTTENDQYKLAQANIGSFNNYVQYGWQCPKCSAVMAPAMMMCFYCKPVPQEENIYRKDIEKIKEENLQKTAISFIEEFQNALSKRNNEIPTDEGTL